MKSALKYYSFDVTIGIKIPFFIVLVTNEPGRSLLQLVTTNCLIIENSGTTTQNVQSHEPTPNFLKPSVI